MIIRNHRRVNASCEHPTPRGRKCIVYRVDNSGCYLIWLLLLLLFVTMMTVRRQHDRRETLLQRQQGQQMMMMKKTMTTMSKTITTTKSEIISEDCIWHCHWCRTIDLSFDSYVWYDGAPETDESTPTTSSVPIINLVPICWWNLCLCGATSCLPNWCLREVQLLVIEHIRLARETGRWVWRKCAPWCCNSAYRKYHERARRQLVFILVNYWVQHCSALTDSCRGIER